MIQLCYRISGFSCSNVAYEVLHATKGATANGPLGAQRRRRCRQHWGWERAKSEIGLARSCPVLSLVTNPPARPRRLAWKRFAGPI
jgi:hypothetical protein